MSLTSKEVLAIALIDVITNKNLEDARERLREDINADLSDIAERINEERTQAIKECRENILRTWFIGGLFNYDYEKAKLALTKCLVLNPSGSVKPRDANKLLIALWDSCQLLFEDDFSVLFDEIDRCLETEKIFEEDELSLPFM